MNRLHCLHLHNRPTGDEEYLLDLTPYAADWQRSVHRFKGYQAGTFSIDTEMMNRLDLIDLYSRAIGCVLKEDTVGMTSWEGVVFEARLVLDGIERKITLDPQWWHNKVKVVYTSTVGYRGSIAWSENTDASDEYGEMQQIITQASSTSNMATSAQVVHLARFAWPRSRMMGSIEIGETPRDEGLHISVVGMGATMNWRYRETSESDTASALITTLVGETEFCTAGRIETNALAVRVDANPAPQRIGDLIESIIEQGDGTNLWQGGVYADKKLVYEQAPTTVDYRIRQGVLTDKGGAPVIPSLMTPGVLVKADDMPLGWPTRGTYNVWDDPQVGYVEQVEFRAPGTLALKIMAEEESVVLLEKQLEALFA